MVFKNARLSTRLLVASAIVLPLFLGISAYMLDLAFRNSLLAAERDRLNGRIYLLLAAADVVDGELQLPDRLTEPLFEQLNSGLYAFIYDKQGNEVWRSPSAVVLGTVPDEHTPIDPGSSKFDTRRINDSAYFQFSFDIAYETERGDTRQYRFVVLHTQEMLHAELVAYRRQLWWLLGSLALLLLVTQGLIMYWGLRPLKRVAQDLKKVEQGEAKLLEGDYPGEIRPVTENLNQVLVAERSRRERYKNTLADLAHSLKTPLAILRGALEQPADKLTILLDEQINRMDQIVRHQLQRAVISNQAQPGQRVDVMKSIVRVRDALSKVYRDKAVKVEIPQERAAYFYGEESDLLEVLGNILDNAYKYCHSCVRVGIENNDTELVIRIADDGPGVDESIGEQILQRGARADSSQPGYGIGLSVAADIISSYKGGLSVRRSELGGAEFVLVLPDSAGL